MLRLLFLDDCPKRTAKFKQSTLDAAVHLVATAKAAIEVLGETSDKFDAMFLDHDLGGAQGKFTEDNNGMLVAEYIVVNFEKYKNTVIVVHSLNHVAGWNMVYKMQAVGLNVTYDAGAWARVSLDQNQLVIRPKWG